MTGNADSTPIRANNPCVLEGIIAPNGWFDLMVVSTTAWWGCGWCEMASASKRRAPLALVQHRAHVEVASAVSKLLQFDVARAVRLLGISALSK